MSHSIMTTECQLSCARLCLNFECCLTRLLHILCPLWLIQILFCLRVLVSSFKVLDDGGRGNCNCPLGRPRRRYHLVLNDGFLFYSSPTDSSVWIDTHPVHPERQNQKKYSMPLSCDVNCSGCDVVCYSRSIVLLETVLPVPSSRVVWKMMDLKYSTCNSSAKCCCAVDNVWANVSWFCVRFATHRQHLCAIGPTIFSLKLLWVLGFLIIPIARECMLAASAAFAAFHDSRSWFCLSLVNLCCTAGKIQTNVSHFAWFYHLPATVVQVICLLSLKLGLNTGYVQASCKCGARHFSEFNELNIDFFVSFYCTVVKM